MFISDFAIQRPIVTVTAMVALVVFGIFALLNLHTDEFPDIQQPVVGVNIVYPGASPSEVTGSEACAVTVQVDWKRPSSRRKRR